MLTNICLHYVILPKATNVAKHFEYQNKNSPPTKQQLQKNNINKLLTLTANTTNERKETTTTI